MEWRDTCPRNAVWLQPPSGWSWVNCPGRLLAEESLQRLLRETDWGLVRRDPEGFFLAFPYGGDVPFPLPPLFCLSGVGTLEERRYIIFRFSRRGWAEVLHNFPFGGEATSGT